MQALNIFHVLIAISLCAFILIQKGPGATAGAAFGSGASGTVFGARGASNFLSKTTWVLATLFCTISMVMAVMVSRTSALPENDLGVMGADQVQAAQIIESEALVIDVIEEEISVTADDSAESDMPFMDTGSGDTGSGDLPVLDTEVIENTITEDARVVTDGSDG